MTEMISVEETFGGYVVHSIRHRKNTYREFFEWVVAPNPSVAAERFLGDQIVDMVAFSGVLKEGPSVVYRRRLANDSGTLALGKMFGGNRAIEDPEDNDLVSAISRPKVASREGLLSEEEYREFAASYPPGAVEDYWGSRDAVWDAAAAHGWRWLIARAIVLVEDAPAEWLVWLGSPPRQTHQGLVEAAEAAISQFAGARLADGLIELYDTHYERPHPTMLIFEIERRSTLEFDEYVSTFIPSSEGLWL